MTREETVPCYFCGEPTLQTYTQQCNDCWETNSRLERFLRNPRGRARALILLAKVIDNETR